MPAFIITRISGVLDGFEDKHGPNVNVVVEAEPSA
jgi:hypothetical protein